MTFRVPWSVLRRIPLDRPRDVHEAFEPLLRHHRAGEAWRIAIDLAIDLAAFLGIALVAFVSCKMLGRL